MSGILNQAADRHGPEQITTRGTYVSAIIVLTEDGTAHTYDMEDSSHFNSAKFEDRYVCIAAENAGTPVGFFHFWSDNASAVIDKTATGNGQTVSSFIPSGIVEDERPKGRYLAIQTVSAAHVHIWFSSGKF